MLSDVAKSFDNTLATSLNIVYNYFDDLTKLFSDLYLVKFSDTSTKSLFPCKVFDSVMFAKIIGVAK